MAAIIILICGIIVLLLSLFIGFGGLGSLTEALQRGVTSIPAGLFSLFLIYKAIDSLFPEDLKRTIAWLLRRIPNIPTSFQRRAIKNEVEGTDMMDTTNTEK
ncbi:MAG: hypothetical protein H8E40_13745, partial [Chloroflexi bacterium]|nr:hypothetical protein [Chloroflexota bacterium]